MKTNILNKILVLMLFSIFCLHVTISARENNKTDNSKSDTTWKYLGRPRPGMTPLRFPADSLLANIYWMWHGTPIFSPDLKEIYWSKYDRIADRGMLVYVKYLNNIWTSMQNAPFGEQNYFESSPVYSLSGDTLFFTSLRQGGFFFRTCRTSSGWTTPEPLNIPIPQGYQTSFEFSMSRNGTIYFALLDTVHNLKADIYKSKLINGIYQTPINLGTVINSDSSDVNPCIDPDERFIIFASKRAGGYGLHDLYISTCKPDSSWNNPINLGNTINTSFEDVFPSITPDSLYFFYTTAKSGDIGYNPYWVSIQYIKNLISIGIIKQTENANDFKLYQNYPNPFNPVTKIKFAVASTSPLHGESSTYPLQRGTPVTLKVFDLLGKEVAILINEKLQPGTYEVTFNGSNLPSGVYFCKLETDNFIETKKMIIFK